MTFLKQDSCKAAPSQREDGAAFKATRNEVKIYRAPKLMA
jgi:hypothetical protein